MKYSFTNKSRSKSCQPLSDIRLTRCYTCLTLLPIPVTVMLIINYQSYLDRTTTSNSVGLDQTAPWSSLIRTCTVCDCSSNFNILFDLKINQSFRIFIVIVYVGQIFRVNMDSRKMSLFTELLR